MTAADETISQCKAAGLDFDALGERLQIEGRDAFNKSWGDLMDAIDEKCQDLQSA